MRREGYAPWGSVGRWLFTTNHKDIGLLYLVTSLYFLVLGGVLALLIRLQLLYPNLTLLRAGAFNQAVTVHGLLMVLWFLSPFAFAFANYFVPLQIGARDLAFPRLNALSYWLYLLGGLLAAVGFFTPDGAIDAGWTVYAPLNTAKFSPQVGVTLGGAGLVMLVASVTISTINFLVTIFRLRAPGMTLRRMPIFSWGILLTVFMMLLAFPSLATGLLLLVADRLLGTLFFVSEEGGALLWDHLFWFFGHPEVYIVLMPALMATAEILPVFARRPLYGKRFVVGAAIVASIMSFMVWAHHMFVTGIDPGFRKFMTITTEAISVPFGVIILCFILTLFRSSIRFTTPMLFALGSIALFIIGGITGVFNSSVALDYNLRGTYWVVGHFHYTLVGGATTGLIAALYYWWPKMSGRLYSERLGKLHFILYMIGFNLLYFPMQLLIDMPRRVFTYDPEFWGLNFLSSVGSLVFGATWPLFFLILIQSLLKGPKAGENPWRAWGFEWMTSSPPPEHNFNGMPMVDVDGRLSIQASLTDGGGAHQAASHSAPSFCYWPPFLALGAFLILLGAGLSPLILPLGLLVLALSLLGWARDDLVGRFVRPEPALGERWPFTKVDNNRLGIWTLLFGEVVLFGSLIASYIFLRANSAQWPSAGQLLDPWHGAINTFILLTSSLTAVMALAAVRTGYQRGLKVSLLATFGLGLAFLISKGFEWSKLFEHGFTLSHSLATSAYYIITGTHGAHVAAGLIVLIYLIAKAFKGRYNREEHHAIEHFGLYWHFVDIVWVFLFPLFYLL